MKIAIKVKEYIKIGLKNFLMSKMYVVVELQEVIKMDDTIYKVELGKTAGNSDEK